ncbi:translation initiation factor eIF-2 beta subunit [Dispira simplex]|nr:translation initiation factor eIF-2 beta subunit [Dispira simplex]
MADANDLTQKLEQTHIEEGQEESTAEPLFDLSMKKKKKKKKVDFDMDTEGAEPSAGAGEEDDATALFADLKKKKKKKAKAPLLDEETKPADQPAESEAPEEFDFAELKKKKKKSKKVDFAAFEAQLEGNEMGHDVFGEGSGDEGSGAAQGEEAWIGTNRDYIYPELLGRFFKILRQNNPELAGEKKRYTIAPPQIAREGNKKTIFANVSDIAKRMHRQPDHVIQFLFAELGTSGSVDGSQRLVIKGRFSQKQMESVLRRYIVEYVTCKTCKSPDTLLTKEGRLFFVQCESCGATRSVSAIKTGFQAQTTKRAAIRRAAA